VMVMLEQAGVKVQGANVVVLGRSTIVGKPMTSLLVNASATVTVCHSKTKDLAAVTRGADILIAAIGKPEFVTADMVKPGAVVIDVGINRVEDASKEKGYRIVGDVQFSGVREVASKITPVPGGVGPMTIAMLLKNTVRAAAWDGAVAV
jgi:methylenetetrahydrofolate dehydrogenase (NADP+) / methenyltetrahydrofolate cyclohydrolase